jgi:hypothetical protein
MRSRVWPGSQYPRAGYDPARKDAVVVEEIGIPQKVGREALPRTTFSITQRLSSEKSDGGD